MSNQQIVNSFQYSLSLIVLLILFVWWHLAGRVTKLEKKHKSSGVSEGMRNPYANTEFRNGSGYLASDALLGNQAGTNGFSDERASAKSGAQSGFFGGSEPPVFYDIGDVRAARTTQGWSTGYLTDAAGNPVYGADGKPVMASKADDYKSIAARKAMYGKTGTAGYNTSDARLRSMGYRQSIDPLTGKPVWKTRKTLEGLWSPAAQEGLWSPANEGFKSDEELFNQR